MIITSQLDCQLSQRIRIKVSARDDLPEIQEKNRIDNPSSALAGIELLESRAMPYHIHLCLGIPPKQRVEHDRIYQGQKRDSETQRASWNLNRNSTVP